MYRREIYASLIHKEKNEAGHTTSNCVIQMENARGGISPNALTITTMVEKSERSVDKIPCEHACIVNVCVAI
jgi:hypothetical protein